jgi:hypothetical protein
MQPRVVLASQAACPKERCPTASNGEFCCLRITRLQHTADHSFTVAVILTVTSCRLHHTHCHCMHLSRSSRLALSMLNMSMLLSALHPHAAACGSLAYNTLRITHALSLPSSLSPAAAYITLPWHASVAVITSGIGNASCPCFTMSMLTMSLPCTAKIAHAYHAHAYHVHAYHVTVLCCHQLPLTWHCHGHAHLSLWQRRRSQTLRSVSKEKGTRSCSKILTQRHSLRNNRARSNRHNRSLNHCNNWSLPWQREQWSWIQ